MASHGHDHGHGDHWSGEDYLKMPGVQEGAVNSADNVLYALMRAGLPQSSLGNLSLLEVGCGPGLVTSKLAPHFGSVHAIDISPAMLKTFASQPAAALPNVTYAQHTLHAGSGDDFVRATPQPSPTPSDPARTERPPREKFDVAVTNLVIHHVDNLDQFFKGVASLLVPGGKIVITEFSTLRDGSDPLAELREKAMREAPKETEGSVNAPGKHHMTFSPELLGALLHNYGFEDVGGDRRGTITWGGEEIPTLYMYASKRK